MKQETEQLIETEVGIFLACYRKIKQYPSVPTEYLMTVALQIYQVVSERKFNCQPLDNSWLPDDEDSESDLVDYISSQSLETEPE